HLLRQDTAPRAKSTDMEHVHVRAEELRLPQRPADVVLHHQRGSGGAPGPVGSLSGAGGAGGTLAASRSKSARYSAFVRSDASAPPASSLATLARTLLWPAGNSEITTARPLNSSQNRSLPTAASMLPPIPAPRPQPVGAHQRLPSRAEFLGPARRLGPDQVLRPDDVVPVLAQRRPQRLRHAGESGVEQPGAEP